MATRNNGTTKRTARRIISVAWFALLVSVWPAPGAELPVELTGSAAVTRREGSN